MSKAVQRRRGTTAEHTTFTGALAELTVDTTKDTVVVHDGAAAGGFPLLREDGSNSALAIGSAGTPSLKFTGDPNTGLYSPGADQVAISTAGTGRLFVDASGNVGIGTSTPNTNNYGGSVLGVFAASNAGGNIWLTSDASTSGNRTGRIGFGTTSNTSQETARIWSLTEGSTASNLGGNLVFNTKADAGGLSERLRITSAGNVGIGTSSPTTNLSVAASTNATLRLSGNATSYGELIFSSLGSGWDAYGASIEGTGQSTGVDIGCLIFKTSPGGVGNTRTERLRITSDGNVGIGTSVPQHLAHVSSATNFGAVLKVSDINSNATGAIALGDGASAQVATGIWRAAANSYSTAGNALNVQGESIQFMSGAGIFGAATERLRITSTGNVGIGTSSPANKFTVSAANNDLTSGFLQDGATTGYNTIAIKNTSGHAFIGVNGSTVGTVATNAAAYSTVVGTYNSTDLHLITNDVVRATVDTSGRLLVGTSAAPSAGDGQSSRLVVQGSVGGDTSYVAFARNAAATAITVNQGIGLLNFTDNAGNTFGRVECYADANAGSSDYPGRLVFSTTADGAATPTERLRIDSAGTATLTSAAATAPFIAKISTTEVARIDSSGRLLVGTSTARSGVFFNGDANANPSFQIERAGDGAATASCSLALVRNTSSNAGPGVLLARSAGTTNGSVTSVASGDTIGAVSYQAADGTDFVEAVRIEAFVDGTPGANDMPGRLVFSTTADGASSPTERMRIVSGGNVGIGETNPLSTLSIRKDTVGGRGAELSIVNYAATTQGNEAALNFGIEASTYDSNSCNAQIKAVLPNVGSAATDFVFSNFNGSAFGEAMRIHNQRELLIGTTTRTANGGVLQISNGITFPGTQSACSDANTLDDYEEGTFTPSVGGNATYTKQVGSYTKVGRMVSVRFEITINTLGTGSTIAISGLPFSVGNVDTTEGYGAVGYFASLAVNVTHLTCYAAANTSNILFNSIGAAGATATNNPAIFGNSARVQGSVTYFV